MGRAAASAHANTTATGAALASRSVPERLVATSGAGSSPDALSSLFDRTLRAVGVARETTAAATRLREQARTIRGGLAAVAEPRDGRLPLVRRSVVLGPAYLGPSRLSMPADVRRILRAAGHDDEVIALLGDLHERRDAATRNAVVGRFLGLADRRAAAWVGHGGRDDVVQVARLALIDAVDRFDPLRGLHFASFAAATIDGALKRQARDAGWTIRPPRRVQELSGRVGSVWEELGHELSRNPTRAEVADRTGSSVGQVDDVFLARRSAIGTDAGVPIPTKGASPLDDIEHRLRLTPLLDRLGSRHRRAVELRYWSGLTEREIGEELGVSQSYVSRLLREALRRMHAGEPDR